MCRKDIMIFGLTDPSMFPGSGILLQGKSYGKNKEENLKGMRCIEVFICSELVRQLEKGEVDTCMKGTERMQPRGERSSKTQELHRNVVRVI
jgi:hypothetical protein